MTRIAQPIRVRLIGGYVLVLFIFATAAILSMNYADRILASSREIAQLQRGLEASLRVATQLGRIETAIGDVMYRGELEPIGVVDEALRRMDEARARVSLTLGADEVAERAWLAESERLSRELETRFNDEFVPAVLARRHEAIAQRREECRRTLAALQARNDRITRSRENRIQAVTREADALRAEGRRDMGLLLALAVGVAVMVAFRSARSVSQPIGELMQATEAVARGDLTRALDERRRDEFGQLARSFNKMSADLQEHQRRLVQAEKMASLGRLAAGMAHEINNPIGVILGYTRLLLSDASLPANVAEDLRAIDEEAEQCQRIVRDLLDFARAAPAPEAAVDVRQVLEDVLERVRRMPFGSAAEIVPQIEPARCPVMADHGRLRQAFENIVRNALEAMPRGGTLRIGLRRSAPATDGRPPGVEVVFEDTGPGIPAALISRIFEPFFSTKPKGTGLGLAIAYSSVRAYGGDLAVESEVGRGARFPVSLPLAEGSPDK